MPAGGGAGLVAAAAAAHPGDPDPGRVRVIEAAKAVLGHTDTRVTEIYAERDLELAAKVMKEIG